MGNSFLSRNLNRNINEIDLNSKRHMKRVTSIELPTNSQNFKKLMDSDDSPNNECGATHDGSDYGTNLIPLSLSFSEKERVYVLVQWKLKKLMNS